MQIAYKAKDITEAHIVANLLISNGIHAHVGGITYRAHSGISV